MSKNNTITQQTLIQEIKNSEFFIKNKIFSIVQDEELTKDIMQSAYLKALENIHNYSPTFSISAWLTKIATNLAIDHKRKSKNITVSIFTETEEDTSLIEKIDSNSPTPLQELLSKNEKAKIYSLIKNNCSFSEKRLLVLRFKKDLKLNDCAKELNIPSNTVKTKLSRLLTKLKTAPEWQ